MDKKLLLRRMRKNKFFVVGTILTVFLLLAVFLAPLYIRFSPDKSSLAERLVGADWSKGLNGHLFGTDAMGRDVFTRILIGGRYSLIIAFIVTFFRVIIGTVLGLIAGYTNNRTVDTVIMRACDVFLSLPSLIVALAIIAVMGTSIRNLVIVLIVTDWMQYCRVIRNNVRVIRSQEYVRASTAFGASHAHILFKQILPNVTTPLLVLASQGIGSVVLVESGLSYLNLGIQPPTPSWCNMIADGRLYLQTSPWLMIAPGIALLLTAIAFNCLGDGLRDVLDPKTL